MPQADCGGPISCQVGAQCREGLPAPSTVSSILPSQCLLDRVPRVPRITRYLSDCFPVDPICDPNESVLIHCQHLLTPDKQSLSPTDLLSGICGWVNFALAFAPQVGQFYVSETIQSNIDLSTTICNLKTTESSPSGK